MRLDVGGVEVFVGWRLDGKKGINLERAERSKGVLHEIVEAS